VEQNNLKVPQSDYTRYLIREPLWITTTQVRNRQSPEMTLISAAQLHGLKCCVRLGWIYGEPEPNPYIHEHAHRCDEIVLLIGTDPDHPERLGAEVEYCIVGKPLLIDATSAVFIPAGVLQGPITWKSVDRPHLQMTVMLGVGSCRKTRRARRFGRPKESPYEEAGEAVHDEYPEGKPLYQPIAPVREVQQPAAIRLNNARTPAVHHYLELGWVTGISGSDPGIAERTHDFDTIILHLGTDPENPLDLGAEIECLVNGQRLTIDTTSALWVPGGLRHGPFIWKKSQRPHLRLAFQLNCTGSAEG
jgi:hypothetical protein